MLLLFKNNHFSAHSVANVFAAIPSGKLWDAIAAAIPPGDNFLCRNSFRPFPADIKVYTNAGRLQRKNDGGYPASRLFHCWRTLIKSRTHTNSPQMRSREHGNSAFWHTRHEGAVKNTRIQQREVFVWALCHLSLETKSGAQSHVTQRAAAGWWSDGYLLIGMLLSAQSMHTIFCLALANRFCLTDGIANAVHADWNKRI